MSTFRVVVDDPGMADRHEIVLRAAGEHTAVLEASRRAILLDRFGCGPGGAVPRGENPDTYEMPLLWRAAHAGDTELVEAVARYATVAAVSADEEEFELPAWPRWHVRVDALDLPVVYELDVCAPDDRTARLLAFFDSRAGAARLITVRPLPPTADEDEILSQAAAYRFSEASA